MREIVLDTETTGLDPKLHRVIDIGCVELWDGLPTGRIYQAYINPERDVPKEATAISGLTGEFLRPFPIFSAIAEDFLNFIEDSTLIIHNARFDIGFLNSELERLKKPIIPITRAFDTVVLARKLFPGSPANLDALCKRFNIDLSKRTNHGALLDAQLLAHVYLELQGGRQRILELKNSKIEQDTKLDTPKVFRASRKFSLNEDEAKKHSEFITTLKNPLWLKVS